MRLLVESRSSLVSSDFSSPGITEAMRFLFRGGYSAPKVYHMKLG